MFTIAIQAAELHSNLMRREFSLVADHVTVLRFSTVNVLTFPQTHLAYQTLMTLALTTTG
jgi:hypothetical protein